MKSLTNLCRRVASTKAATGWIPPTEAATLEREEWLEKAENQRFKEMPEGRGPFWIAKTPFPTNPHFKPKAPISNKSKDEIYEMFTKDPTVNTPFVLAELFGISQVRVKGIIKLKSIQAKYVKNGIELQNDLSLHMDRLMGAIKLEKHGRKYEELKLSIAERLRPYFVMRDEELPAMSPNEAAELLQKDPLFDMKDVFVDKHTKKQEKPRVIQVDESNTSKYTFVFHVQGEKEGYVRESNGKLREASKFEQYLRKL